MKVPVARTRASSREVGVSPVGLRESVEHGLNLRAAIAVRRVARAVGVVERADAPVVALADAGGLAVVVPDAVGGTEQGPIVATVVEHALPVGLNAYNEEKVTPNEA